MCEICGRSSCTRSFHSLSQQEEFDTKTGRYAPESELQYESARIFVREQLEAMKG